MPDLSHFFHALSDFTLGTLVALLLILGLTFTFQWMADRKLAHAINKQGATPLSRKLFAQLRARSFFCLAAIVCVLVTILFQDIQTPSTPTESDIIDRTIDSPTPTPRATNMQIITDLLAPEATDGSVEAELDVLKRKYENGLIGAYILHHCNRATEHEITSLTIALKNELSPRAADLKALGMTPQEFMNNIATGAEGSFQALYSHMDCNTAAISQLEADFTKFMSNANKIPEQTPSSPTPSKATQP